MRLFFLILLVMAGWLGAVPLAFSQGRAGAFDHYLLALSWSPTWCLEDQGRRADAQCAAQRTYGFVVHGLWPQYAHGFPRACIVPAPRLPRHIVDEMLDLMPSRRLIYRQWDQHGTCSGLEAEAYFQTVRQAWQSLVVPESFQNLQQDLTVSPRKVIEAFVEANPSLDADAIHVTCRGERIGEVRICLGKDLMPQACPAALRKSCTRSQALMPMLR